MAVVGIPEPMGERPDGHGGLHQRLRGALDPQAADILPDRTPVAPAEDPGEMDRVDPDFRGDLAAIETVVDSGLEVYAQNVETVRRLTHPVRDARAGYEQTLEVLAHAKRFRPGVLTKTSLMLGLGETDAEIRETMADLKAAAVDIVTFGQYLRPTQNHLAVERFVTPDEFAEYRRIGLDMGFLEVVSGPLVRSSYRADRVFEQNNVGL